MVKKWTKNQIIIFAFLIGSLGATIDLAGVDFGSDTAVTRFEAQITLDNGDRVAGFAALEGGFSLIGIAVDPIFDSFFPVSGNLEFSGLTLELERDLILSNTADVLTLGNIIGNFHTFELSPSITTFPSTALSGGQTATCFGFGDLKLILNCDVNLGDCCISFTGDCVLNGRGNCLSFSDTCTLEVAANSTLLIKDITLKNVHERHLRNLDDTSKITFKNVKMVLDDDYCFDKGSFDVIKDFHIIGDGHTFVYQTDQLSTVSTCGSLIIDHGVTFSYAPLSVIVDGNLKLIDETSFLVLRGGTLQVDNTGLTLTKGKLIVERKSFLSNDGVSVAEGISFGDGVSAVNNLTVEVFPEAHLELLSGFAQYANI